MATTTPNFGWPVPTSTDLVKDGATAMEALGDAIDTSMVDLKGGTTGQVLAKASATDMDFSWVAQDDSNAIQNSIVNAKGDLIGASANDTPAILSVGNNGETLVADASTSTGLRWQGDYAAGKNAVLNSNFEIWQRGTSVAAANGSGAYTADRWSAYNISYTVSRQSTSDTTNLPFINNCARVQRNLSATATNGVNFVQPLESVNSKPFIGKVATLSFYARAGANYSSASSALLVYLLGGTGTDQNPNNTYTGQTIPISQTATLTTTWQRFSYTTASTLATTINELATQFTSIGVGTAGANDYFEVTGVQLEIGSVATAYSPNSGTFQGELAACQRYYEKSYDQATALGTATFVGAGGGAYGTNSTGYSVASTYFRVTKRVAPTITSYDTAGASGKCSTYASDGTVTTGKTPGVDQIGQTGFREYENGTSKNGLFFQWTADAEL